MQRPIMALVRSRVVLQLEEHVVDDENGVLGAPGRGLAAQHHVLDGFARSAANPAFTPAVYAVSSARSSAGSAATHAPRPPPKPMDARALSISTWPSHDLRQLARGAAAHQVHLEEALLAVQPAQGEDGVRLVLGLDPRDAEGIALDLHLGAQARDLRPPRPSRQAAAQLAPEPEAGGAAGDEDDAHQDAEDEGQPLEEAHAGDSLRRVPRRALHGQDLQG
jgi:hypothetical protein